MWITGYVWYNENYETTSKFHFILVKPAFINMVQVCGQFLLLYHHWYWTKISANCLGITCKLRVCCVGINEVHDGWFLPTPGLESAGDWSTSSWWRLALFSRGVCLQDSRPDESLLYGGGKPWGQHLAHQGPTGLQGVHYWGKLSSLQEMLSNVYKIWRILFHDRWQLKQSYDHHSGHNHSFFLQLMCLPSKQLISTYCDIPQKVNASVLSELSTLTHSWTKKLG